MDEKYGLDFGTSNSSIAILQHGYLRALPVDPSALNPAVTSFRSCSSIIAVVPSSARKRSVCSWRRTPGARSSASGVSSGKLVDTDYGPEHVQFDADVDMPGRFFQAIKILPSQRMFEGTDVFGAFWTIEQLAGGSPAQDPKPAPTRQLGRQGIDVV